MVCEAGGEEEEKEEEWHCEAVVVGIDSIWQRAQRCPPDERSWLHWPTHQTQTQQ